MTEEQVTKAFLKKMIESGWKIICFDFPQSGTGRFLHPNNAVGDKNLGTINPDIVAVKDGICLFFENKDHFYYPDYEKQNKLITNNQYTEDISKLLKGNVVKTFFYGIGIPTTAHGQKSVDSQELVDFVFGVEEDKSVIPLYNPNHIEL